jgi:hypothetical protein
MVEALARVGVWRGLPMMFGLIWILHKRNVPVRSHAFLPDGRPVSAEPNYGRVRLTWPAHAQRGCSRRATMKAWPALTLARIGFAAGTRNATLNRELSQSAGMSGRGCWQS